MNTFKFKDFLSSEELAAMELLREKLGGRRIYIRYPEDFREKQYHNKRNRRMVRMYQVCKQVGMSDRQAFAEVSIRVPGAYCLSMSRIRHIVKGHHQYGKR